MIALAEGRATTMQCSVQKYDWLSHETVIIDVDLTSPPNGVPLQAQWVVYDDDGKVVIISSDKGICIAYAKQIKGVLTYD